MNEQPTRILVDELGEDPTEYRQFPDRLEIWAPVGEVDDGDGELALLRTVRPKAES